MFEDLPQYHFERDEFCEAFFKMFTDEWREEIHIDKVKRTYQVSSDGIDVNSMYSKLMANSIYGSTLKPYAKAIFSIKDLPKEN